MTEPLINANKLEKIFNDCLFLGTESTESKVHVIGIGSEYHFHPERLESHREEIKEILSNLNPTFFKSGGGGWSFLNMCNDKNDEQWTGFHSRMSQLMVLGMGLDLVSYLMPREMWGMFSGGMPYIVVNL